MLLEYYPPEYSHKAAPQFIWLWQNQTPKIGQYGLRALPDKFTLSLSLRWINMLIIFPPNKLSSKIGKQSVYGLY